MAMRRRTDRIGTRRDRESGGFTLLEVLLATSLLAVGAVSVLVVLASAAGFAARRQTQQRLTQVLDEARNDARAIANAFRPSKDEPLPGGDDATFDAKASALYGGYEYQLSFGHVDSTVPEAGYRVRVEVTYGDEQSHTENLIVGADAVPDEEFAKSITYEAERSGEADTTGGSEAR
jgi:prepilin-type N-terminal cleavage/methylation domain-containing protein